MQFIIILGLVVSRCMAEEYSYDRFCDERELFRPYVEIYQERGGTLLDSGGPKFYPTSHLSNIYTCLNGPAWLYYARHTAIGDVYHQPEYKVYQHECQAFNGKPGPGSHSDPMVLMGIYMLGKEEDYRLPSIHLFTAPLFNNVTNLYENVTSFMTIGNSPCTVHRGKDVKIIVIPEPDKPERDTNPGNPEDPTERKDYYCKMAYQNIDIMFPKEAKVSEGGDSEESNLLAKDVKGLFKNDESLREGECKESKGIPRLVDWIKMLNNSRDEYIKKFEKENTTLLELKFPEAESDLSGNITEATTKLEELIGKLPTLKDEEKRIQEKNKTDIENMLEKLKFYQDAYYKTGNVTALPTISFYWQNQLIEELEKPEAGLKVNITEYEKNKTALEKLESDSTTTKETLDTARKALKEFEVTIKQEVRKFTILQYEAESNSRKALELARSAIRAIRAAQRAKGSTQKFKEQPMPSSGVLKVERLPPKDVCTGDCKLQNCELLPNITETCIEAKPQLTRACHFLKAITDGPEICQDDEDVKPKPNDNKPRATQDDLIGKEFVEIINLIEHIFAHACQRLNPQFARRINRVFKCYLLKPTKHGGAGFDNREGSANPKTNKDFNKMWMQIKQALLNCKQEKKKLVFKRDTSNTEKKTFLLKVRNGTSSYTKEIFLHKEQADLQFAFNFAIDMHFKMFATVMGLCMASETYLSRNSLLTSEFFSKYTDLFFSALEATWTDPKDNRIFNLILGNFKNGGGKFWANRCMEASFIKSEDVNFRPPRKIFVNSHTEGNYFINGKLANTQGMYSFRL